MTTDDAFGRISREARTAMADDLDGQLGELCRVWAKAPQGSAEADDLERRIHVTQHWAQRFRQDGTVSELRYEKLDETLPDLIRGSEHAAGIDLYNAGPSVTLEPGGEVIVPCGVKIEIPEGHWGHISIRSGLGFNQGLSSHLGVVDADFRGELRVKLFQTFNLAKLADHWRDDQPVFSRDRWKAAMTQIAHGERIANLVIVPYAPLVPVRVRKLSPTVRGEDGYGSTGR